MKFLRTRRHSDHYKWWVLSCTSLGMLLATVNSGTLIIALPDLERSLHTTLLQLVWVILVYMIVVDRARADGRPPLRSLRPQERLRARLPRSSRPRRSAPASRAAARS